MGCGNRHRSHRFHTFIMGTHGSGRLGSVKRIWAQPMSVLLVTKPMVSPWHDSSSQLARVLAAGLHRLDDALELRVMTTPDGSGLDGVVDESIYRGGGGFAPGVVQNLRVFRRLLGHRGESLRHFFFAPNPRSAFAARVARRFRSRPSLHTLCSMPPAGQALAPALFADRNLVLSEAALQRLAKESLEAHFVEPAVLPLTSSELGRARCQEKYGDYLLFAGDLRPGGGALEALETLARLPEPLNLVIACRPKGSDHLRCLAEVERRIEDLGLAARVHRLGRVEWIGDLVAGSRLQLLPATDLTAKMDYPLVLLEGLAAGVPTVVAQGAPFAALADGKSVMAAPAEDAASLKDACETLLMESAKAAARALYQSRFLPERFAAEVLQHYRALGLEP